LLESIANNNPGIEVLRALAQLEGTPVGRLPQTLSLLQAQPTLSAALEVVDAAQDGRCEGEALLAVREALARAAQPAQRYRCAACGFEALRYFWQCPGCLAWDSFPPRRLEDN
jgi:lipopolysaccharide biosynthesis regulator YciM